MGSRWCSYPEVSHPEPAFKYHLVKHASSRRMVLPASISKRKTSTVQAPELKTSISAIRVSSLIDVYCTSIGELKLTQHIVYSPVTLVP